MAQVEQPNEKKKRPLLRVCGCIFGLVFLIFFTVAIAGGWWVSQNGVEELAALIREVDFFEDIKFLDKYLDMEELAERLVTITPTIELGESEEIVRKPTSTYTITPTFTPSPTSSRAACWQRPNSPCSRLI